MYKHTWPGNLSRSKTGPWPVSHALNWNKDHFFIPANLVYGPHTNSEREDLWYELASIRGTWDGQWVLGGDFNVCRFDYEKFNCHRKKGHRRTRAMENFSKTILDLGLMDLPLSNIHHKPLMLECRDGTLAHPTSSLKTCGYIQKLKYLKKDISTWNKEVFGKLEEQRKQLAKIEEVSWRQKVKMFTWAQDGAGNTKYFRPTIGISVSEKMNHGDHLARFENLARIFERKVLGSGADGFTMAFFQHAEIIKYEIIKALRHYHQHRHMVKSVNATFISLIPKKKGAIELEIIDQSPY
ncbi:hypothetical protein H5410_053208 [Solanum commersonii]|uniref:Uncharacterized protein n=1 Tax=Solanum commersonii TaxID=4109 RepID=A0A9J5X5C0_SOLCO|nr:hypothetical protein H5410_053208 [Solanum commersonii]